MFGFIIFLACIITTMFVIVTLPILIYSKEIRIPWRLFAIFIGPAVATGILIKDPWFTTFGVWRWLRLILVFSWIPALLELERRGHLIYESTTRKWLSRWALYSLLSVFTVWAVNKTEGWGLIQAHFNGNSWCWLAETTDGEDGYIFTTDKNNHIQSEKLLDSVGTPYIYSYYIQSNGNQLELRSSQDKSVSYYDPTTHISEYVDESGNRSRYHRKTGASEEWNLKIKTWERRK